MKVLSPAIWCFQLIRRALAKPIVCSPQRRVHVSFKGRGPVPVAPNVSSIFTDVKGACGRPSILLCSVSYQSQSSTVVCFHLHLQATLQVRLLEPGLELTFLLGPLTSQYMHSLRLLPLVVGTAVLKAYTPRGSSGETSTMSADVRGKRELYDAEQ